MTKKTFILDTNVILTDTNCIYDFGSADIIVPFQVLEEIDKFKKRLDNVGYNARCFIKTLDELRKKGNLFDGVRIHKGKGRLYIKREQILNGVQLDNTPDNKILNVAIVEAGDPEKKVVVITNDINMRIKCDSFGLESRSYMNSQTPTKRENLYSGFATITVDDQVVDSFYAGEEIYLQKDSTKLYPNQFIMLVSNQNDKKTALARFSSYSMPLKKIQEYKKGIFGIIPKNKEQIFALNLLLDPTIQIMTITGLAGGGKSLLTLAAALEQVLEQRSQYKKMIVTKAMLPAGGKENAIGFMPGDKNDKLMPWMSAISDNLEFLLGNDKNALKNYVEDGVIELECVGFLRGRSIANSIMIIEESQNYSAHEIRTIATRVGHNTKLILVGDTSQIDNSYINEFTNGIVHVSEAFKGESCFGHIELTKGERSMVATLSAKLL